MLKSRSITRKGAGRLLKTASKSSRVSCFTLRSRECSIDPVLAGLSTKPRPGPAFPGKGEGCITARARGKGRGCQAWLLYQEMELDNLAGRACDSQSRGINPRRFPKRPVKGAGISSNG